MPWCLFVLACEKFPCLGHIIAEQVTFERNAGLEGDKRRKTSSRVLAGLASIANYGSFHSTKIPVLISKVPRAQWNSIFRLHIPDASHRAFGYCSRKQDARVVLGIAIVSNSVRPTEMTRPVKVAHLQRWSQIIRSDRTEMARLIWFLTEISGILGWAESALYL